MNDDHLLEKPLVMTFIFFFSYQESKITWIRRVYFYLTGAFYRVMMPMMAVGYNPYSKYK